MEDDDLGFSSLISSLFPIPNSQFPPSSSSIPHTTRRLSSCFTEPAEPIESTRVNRRFLYVSLQGRVIGAEECSSAREIGGGSMGKGEESVAWDLFSPIHRILIVAVIAVANLKRGKEVAKLKRSVEIRDKELLSMQEKLDSLWEKANAVKDIPEIKDATMFVKEEGFSFKYSSESRNTRTWSCGCQSCDEHLFQSTEYNSELAENSPLGSEMSKFKVPFSVGVEQEERIMSDYSDWNSSVTSAADFQLLSFTHSLLSWIFIICRGNAMKKKPL